MGIHVASVPAGHVYVRHLSPKGSVDGVDAPARPPPGHGHPGRAVVAAARCSKPGWVRAARRRLRRHARALRLRRHVARRTCVELVGCAAGRTASRSCSPCTTCATRTTTSPGCTTPSSGSSSRPPTHVITLTPGAAAEIQRRWGRQAHVLPAPARRRGAATVAAAARSTTASSSACTRRACAPAWTRCPSSRHIVDDAADRCPGARLRVDAHTDVMTPGFTRTTRPPSPPACASSPAQGRDRPARARLLHRRRAVGLPPVASTSRSCPTASARTPAGWRPATTSAPRSWPRTAASTPSSGRA